MIIFRNPGLIDLNAVRMMGVSVKQPGSFGRFGTGLKYAIATILRSGGQIILRRGYETYEFTTISRVIRGEMFNVIMLEHQSMGITDQLGKDWEPWMVLRELGCNALDEGGWFELAPKMPAPSGNETIIGVEWEPLTKAFHNRKELFVEGDPLWKNEHVRILAGPSSHLFYRGVRVLKLEKPSKFTYDILDEQKLTEDRTLEGMWRVERIITDALLAMKDKELISTALTARDFYESRVNFEGASWGVKPSREFIDASITARETRKLSNESAKKVMLRFVRNDDEDAGYISRGSYYKTVDDAFNYARNELSRIGIEFKDDQKFIIIPDEDMPSEEVKSFVEAGKVYTSASLNKSTASVIALELIARWVDLGGPEEVNVFDKDDAVKLLAPLLVNLTPNLEIDESLVAEDKRITASLSDQESVEIPTPQAASSTTVGDEVGIPAGDAQEGVDDYPF